LANVSYWSNIVVPTNTAFSEGALARAAWSAVAPKYEQPVIPTNPLLQGCAASHSVIS
jgi:hypothetical protein